jgi:peptidoglycan/LPS O-acetylase OafA/YrhL
LFQTKQSIVGDYNLSKLTHQKYRPDIDGLRAIAVLFVVGFHSFPGWFKGGYIGVDVFFVISGFLITSIILNNLSENGFEYTEFYARRARRIFPALIMVLTFSMLYGWITMLPYEYANLGKHIMGGALFSSNIVLWGEAGYFDVAAEAKPLLHLWSLGIEEQFYIFWPLLLGIAWNRKKSFLTVMIMVLLISFSVNIFFVISNPISTFYSPVSRVWELIIGGLLAYVTVQRPMKIMSLKIKNLQSMVGLFLIFLSVIVLTKSSAYPGFYALLPTIGALLLILAGPNTWVNKEILGNRVLVLIGLISYPLYLWHWPALYIVNQLDFESAMEVRLARILAIGMSFLLAYLTFRWIEKPIRDHATGKTALLLTSTLAFVALIGFLIFNSGGVNSRFPYLLQNMEEKPIQAEWREHECFLQPGDNFKSECSEEATSRPQLLLWGDSHGAALYPGLKILGRMLNVGIGQYTISACAPLLDWESPRGKYCAEGNKEILRVIGEKKPEIILLYANWNSNTNIGYEVQNLRDTVENIRMKSESQIFLMGSAPQWKTELPKALWRCYGKETIPDFSMCELDNSIEKLDFELEKLAREINIKYISAYREMCNSDGCLVRVGDDLITKDYGHLTPEASRFLIKKIGSQFANVLFPIQN